MNNSINAIARVVILKDKFEYEDGRIEEAVVINETPHTYFVQFLDNVFGTIYKSELYSTTFNEY